MVILVPFFLISYLLLTKSPYYLDQIKYLGGYIHIKSGPLLINLEGNITNKIITVVLILSPLLFIPLRNKKWMVFTLLFFALTFYSNYYIYVFPSFYHFQYVVTVAPFLYLGLIYGIIIGKETESNIFSNKKIKRFAIKIYIEIKRRKEPIGVLIAVILFAMVFQPYGPLNSSNSNSFNMNIFHPDMPAYNEYKQIADLIPNNNPYVIYQNDLPYIDVHDPALSCLAAFQILYGFNNNFTYILQNLTVTNNVDYAFGYVDGFSGGNQLSMCQAMNVLYEKGIYGIEAFKDGFILLAKSYNNSPKIFNPIQLNTTYLHSTAKYNTTNISLYCNMMVPGTYTFNISANESFSGLIFDNYSIIGSNYRQLNVQMKSERVLSDGKIEFRFNITSKYFLYLPEIIISYSGARSNVYFDIHMKEDEPT